MPEFPLLHCFSKCRRPFVNSPLTHRQLGWFPSLLLTCFLLATVSFLLLNSEWFQPKKFHVGLKMVPNVTEDWMKEQRTLNTHKLNKASDLKSNTNRSITRFKKLRKNDNLIAHAQKTEPVRVIPRIVHQTWETLNVPREFTNWILSWKQNNPQWEYWFWTADDRRNMISEKYPAYLALFDSYPHNINRADVIRYFILYEYGGVYADLDVENLKPLDSLMTDFSCILAQEPDVHTYFVYAKLNGFANNAFMACRPKHPFFKLVIENLAAASKMPNILAQTGPFMLDTVAQKYGYKTISANVSLYYDELLLAPQEYFLPTHDPGIDSHMLANKCKLIFSGTFVDPRMADKSSKLKQIFYRKLRKTCKYLKKLHFVNKPPPTSFCDHHWVHTISNPEKYNGKNISRNVAIKELVPDVQQWLTGHH